MNRGLLGCAGGGFAQRLRDSSAVPEHFAGEPGLDCSGIVLDGPHAAHAALPGTRLFGISFGCLRTFATIKDRSIPEPIWRAPLFAFLHSSVQEPRLLVERPASWSHAEAAALPTVFTTVDMALCELAGLKARSEDKVVLRRDLSLWSSSGGAAMRM